MKTTKDQKEIIKERIYDFRQAVKSVTQRINPQTLGPCHYCEWKITRCYSNGLSGGEMVPVCDLCLRQSDTLFNRMFEYEEPLSAI